MEGMKAAMENGVLTVMVPKGVVKKPEKKSIKITGGLVGLTRREGKARRKCFVAGFAMMARDFLSFCLDFSVVVYVCRTIWCVFASVCFLVFSEWCTC